jgi:hypothetical protein
MATSTIMLFRTFGGALGLSIIGSVLFHQMRGHLLTLSAHSGIDISATLIEKLADPQKLLHPSTRALIPLPPKGARREKASNPVWIAGEKAIPL